MGHSLRYEVNCSILFTELPLLERPGRGQGRRVRRRRILVAVRHRGARRRRGRRFVRAIDDAGVSLVGLNFFAGDMPGGDRGLVSWPARSAEFRDNIPVVAAIGERLGCKAFNALYGNRLDGVSRRGAGRPGRREPGARRAGRRRDRRHGAARAGQRRPALPAAHRRRRGRGDRPGLRRRRSEEHRPAGRPLPPGRQRRRRRQGHRRLHRNTRRHRARADRRRTRPQRARHRRPAAGPATLGPAGGRLRRLGRAGIQALGPGRQRRHASAGCRATVAASAPDHSFPAQQLLERSSA